MFRFSKSLVVLAALVSAAGCNDSVKAPRPIGVDRLGPGQYPRNVAVEKNLDKGLVAGPTIVNESTPDRPMRVTQPVRNVADYPLRIQYQFSFLGSDGRPVRGSDGWRFIELEPRVERFLEASATDTNAVDWRLTVRAAR